MTFGVFIHRPDAIYNDLPAEHYQFPRQYLSRAQACVGDWVLYYEPVKVVGTRGYFAVAKVQRIVDDPTAPGMHLAMIEAGSYLDFADPVPFNDAGSVTERGLLNADGRISGRAQSAVRTLSQADFDRIVARGLADGPTSLPRSGPPAPALGFGLQEEQAPFPDEQERVRTDLLGSRIVRDRVFRKAVLQAYDSRCAVTGLRLINGSGRAEVEAAHIRPVEANGPDSVRNGLALSGTAHWMFDRGLIGIADDGTILLSRHINDAEGARGMLNPEGKVLAPRQAALRPHPHFLQWHREQCFKV